MILFFLKDRSSLQYFITKGMGQSSMRTSALVGRRRERRNPRA